MNIDIRQVQQPEIILYVKSSLNAKLMDLRIGMRGITFGILENVARQYGIKYQRLDNCIEFRAPKSRMRMFIEKLHFSMTKYSLKQF